MSLHVRHILMFMAVARVGTLLARWTLVENSFQPDFRRSWLRYFERLKMCSKIEKEEETQGVSQFLFTEYRGYYSFSRGKFANSIFDNVSILFRHVIRI